MSKPKKKPEPRLEFGRIVRDPKIHNGKPVLSGRDVEVEDIVDLFRQGLTDREILDKHEGKLTRDDLLACRAWQVRFMPGTLTRVFNRVSDQNVVMLDENISYLLIPLATELFGRTSHVYADGLVKDHNDDEKFIWAHMLKNKYQAIITSDRDFAGISMRHRQKIIDKYGSVENSPEPVPAVILLPYNWSRHALGHVLEQYQEQIRQFIKDNDAVYAEINLNGFKKGPPRPGMPSRHGRSNDNGPDGPA